MKKQQTAEEEFPYETFPWKLIFDDRGIEKKCFFTTDHDLKKYIDRYKLNIKKCKISNKYGESLS